MKLAVYSCLLAVFLSAAPDGARGEARAAGRRALLIANSTYQHLPPLETPKPSVDALASALSKARFQPQVVYDLPQTALISTIRTFVETVQPGDFVLIYYAGYGCQSDELNYILPVGFDPKDLAAPGLAAFSVRNLQRKLEQRKAGTKMLVLDASRPAPGLPNGLAAMRAGSNTLVSFSAGQDQAAPDPPGGGVDLYTSALIRAIEEPGSKPAGVLTRTRSEVSRASLGKQVPLVIEAPVPDFAFNPPAAPAVETSNGTGGRPNGVVKAPDGGAVAIATNPNVGQSSTTPMWLMDGGDLRRSGYAPARGPRKPVLAWSVEAGNKDKNSPLIGPDGRVYVWSTRDRMVRCIENGRIVWSLPLPLNEQVGFGADGSVQLSSFTGRTRTLSAEGKPIREGSMDGRYQGLYVWQNHPYNSNGSNSGEGAVTRWYFFRVDDRKWQVELDGQATLPSVDDIGTLYVGTSKGTLYAVNDAAQIVWSYPTGAGPTRGLTVTRNRDVLAAIGQSLFRVREGRLRWKFQGDGDAVTSPPIYDQTGTIYFGKGADFYAVLAGGKELWRVRLGEPVTTAPAMDRSGRIYVASASHLYCIADAGR